MNQSCLAKIQNSYSYLTPAEKRVADFIRRDPGRIVQMTVGELSSSSGVAASGIIRFCRRLGYRGFPQLKISLAGGEPQGEDMILPAVSPDDTVDSVFDKVFQSSIRTLKDTLDLLDRETLQEAVRMLHGAGRIEFYGVGTSATIAMDAYYRLMRIGYPAYFAADSQIMRVSSAGLSPGDAAVGISHSGKSRETRDALRSARSRGAAAIALTSFRDSPITREADITICVYSDESRYPIEAVSARIAHIAVLDAVCVSLALKEYERTTGYIREMNQLFSRLRGQQ